MKEEINLLPPVAVTTRLRRIYLVKGGHLLRFIIGLLALLIVVLMAGQMVNVLMLRFIEDQGTAEHADSEQTVTTVNEINQRLVAADRWVAIHKPWTPVLPDLLKGLPLGVELTGIGLDEETQQLVLKGVFGDREDVVAYQRYLEGLSVVAAVEAPLSNFETGTNATFTFSITRAEE